eukprot:10563327-Prorocentrum_lima.AAC.1
MGAALLVAAKLPPLPALGRRSFRSLALPALTTANAAWGSGHTEPQSELRQVASFVTSWASHRLTPRTK